MKRKREWWRQPLEESESDGKRVLVLEAQEFEVFVEPLDLWKPPRVIVRRGYIEAEVWLDEDDVSFMKPTKFGVRDEVRVLQLVRDHLDDLLSAWYSLKDDVRRGRLDRNVLVD